MHILYEASSTTDHEGVNLLLKSVNVGGGSNKGIFAAWCMAVHTTIDPTSFGQIWNMARQKTDENCENIVIIDYMKDCLAQSKWPVCSSNYCELFNKNQALHKHCVNLTDESCRCAKPTEEFFLDCLILMGVNMREVLIVIIEVHWAKAQPDKDVTKIQMMACWALAYTDKCYGMLVKEN